MPDNTDTPEIVVQADRRDAARSELSNNSSSGFDGYWFNPDSFQFSPFSGDGGGGAAQPAEPQPEGPEIVVTAPTELRVSLEELWQTRDQVLDFLEFDYFGFYRFNFNGDAYTLELYDYSEGEVEVFVFSNDSAYTYITPLDTTSFDLPDGVQHTGPDSLSNYDTEIY